MTSREDSVTKGDFRKQDRAAFRFFGFISIALLLALLFSRENQACVSYDGVFLKVGHYRTKSSIVNVEKVFLKCKDSKFGSG